MIQRNHPEKAIYCMIITTWHSGNGKTITTVKRSVFVVVHGEGVWIVGAWGVFWAVKLFCMIL